MAGKLGKFQIQGFSGWSPKISKRNHIGAIYGLDPQKATNVMVQMLSMTYGNTLDSMLSKFPIKEFENDNEYYWEIIGSARKNIPLVEARTSINGSAVTSGSTVGAGVAPFYLVFAEPWFYDGEVIVGNLNEQYPMRVLGDPIEEGVNYVYKVELMGGITEGIPSARLLAGERFSTEYAPVERGLSRKVGGIHFATPASMRNEWSQIRLHHKVSGELLNQKIAMGIPIIREVNGKVTKSVDTMWMHNVEWEFEKTWSDYKNNLLAYARSNRNSNGEYLNFGKSGEVIRMGAGLFEQMEYCNTEYYAPSDNPLSILKHINSLLYDISFGKIGYGNRTFVIKTGAEGARLFHEAVKQEVSGWQSFQVNADNLGMVKKTTASFSGPTQALAAGYQFTEYYAPMGIHVKLDVDADYDDPVRNKILFNGKPAHSMRYDIMDLGTSDQPNIFKCQIKGKPEYRGYQWGIRNPFTGQTENYNMSYDEDSAIFHRMGTFGVCVLDPSKTVSLIPNIL